MRHSSGQEIDQALRAEHSVPLLVLTPIPSHDPSLTLLPSARDWADGFRGRAVFWLSQL